MAYLYHLVPEDIRGGVLYPLNMLKDIYPDVYEKEASKYTESFHVGELGIVTRDTVLNWKIPHFNCFWNDVLHLSPVKPEEIKQALIEAGANAKRVFYYYQIDPSLLNTGRAIVYLYNDAGHDLTGRGFPPSEPDEVRNYNPEEVGTLPSLLKDTKNYYKKMISEGKRPLIYRRVTHVLYKGTLKISDLKIVSV